MPQAQNLIDRGIPVLLMDGPGQGTTWILKKGYLEVEVEDYYMKMVDWLEADERFSEVAIIGGSTGGYYVPRAAAADPRIKACVTNSGTWYPAEILDFAPIYTHKFALLHGVSDAEMEQIWPRRTLDGIAERIECPLLVVAGENDVIFSAEGSRKIYESAKGL